MFGLYYPLQWEQFTKSRSYKHIKTRELLSPVVHREQRRKLLWMVLIQTALICNIWGGERAISGPTVDRLRAVGLFDFVFGPEFKDRQTERVRSLSALTH